MELDDMKAAWQAFDARLQKQEALNLDSFRQRRLGALRASLRPLLIGQIVQLCVGVLLALLFAPYWVEHWNVPHRVAVGLSLHVYALMFVAFAVRDLVMIQRVDPTAPVLLIQQRIAELRAWRIRVAPVFGAVGCLIWVPLTMWLFDVVFGVDLYATKPAVVVAFLASGMVCLALFVALIRASRHPRRARLANHLADSAAGRSIARAQRLLDEVSAFARDS